MPTRDIVVVMKDDGGTNNVLPIYAELVKRGHVVKVFTNGRAAARLKESNPEFIQAETTDEVVVQCSNPALLVTSMCSDGGIGRDLVPILRGKCPIIAIQDFWGARLVTEWFDPRFRPDYITVNDSLGADLVQKGWPEFDSSRICLTGFPAFDWYASINKEQEELASSEIKSKIRAKNGDMIVLFPCGVLVGASEMLTEVLGALKMLFKRRVSNNLFLIPRVHPRLQTVAPDEFEPWNRLLAEFDKLFPGVVIFDEKVIRADINTLLLASDVTISDYSTSLLQSGLIGSRVGGKANISVMYPKAASDEFKQEFGTLFQEPPFVTTGCTLKAQNREHLGLLIHRSLTDNLVRYYLWRNQSKHLITDGKNSQRVVNFLETLLKGETHEN